MQEKCFLNWRKFLVKGLSESQLIFIKKSIHSIFPKAKILVFGSRINDTSEKYSDLDICIHAKTPLDLTKLSNLKEIFSQSNLPIKIDITDYNRITEDFKTIIDKTSKEI
jgi:uncharacterized protein